jgi:hypothetical protein
MHLWCTKATMVISVLNLQMYAFPPPPTLRNLLLGSIPKAVHSLGVLLFLLRAHHERIGKSSGIYFYLTHNKARCLINVFARALSEIVGSPLPYDDVLSLRDRMWEISPALVRYDVSERTSVDIALAGLQILAALTSNAKVSGQLLKKPITNFYQTDPISRAYVS